MSKNNLSPNSQNIFPRMYRNIKVLVKYNVSLYKSSVFTTEKHEEEVKKEFRRKYPVPRISDSDKEKLEKARLEHLVEFPL